MPIRVTCNNCHAVLKAPEVAAGKSLSCPKCTSRLDVPLTDEEDPLPVEAVSPPAPVEMAQVLDAPESRGTKQCPYCAETIALEAVNCRYCNSMLMGGGMNPAPAMAAPATSLPQTRTPDPVLMAVLSGCCIAGLGQMVLGQVGKEILILLGSVGLAIVTGGVSALVTWPLGGLDAYLVARKLRNGDAVTDWETFPS